MTSHHLLMDGWSMPVLLNELAEVYEAGGDPGVLRRAASYGAYLAWLGRQDKEAARAAWRRELAGADEPTLVAPADTARPPVLPDESTARLPAEPTRALVELARTHGLTVNTLVQGAWALVLARLAGRTDVVFGATVAGRPAELPGVEAMVGLLINTLPVRVRLDGTQPVADLLTGLQERQSAMIAHQHLGLAEIQRLAGPGAVFDTLMVFENYPQPPAAPPDPDLPTFSASAGHQATNYPLTLGVLLTDDLTVRVTSRPDLITRRAAAEAGHRLVRVLEQIVENPKAPVARIDVLGAAERNSVVEGWNDTARPVVADSVVEAFEGWAARSPGAVAVVSDSERVSYEGLEARANRLARYLVGLGVGVESRVGLCLPRGVDMVVAELAVWKAGAAFVPLDPEYPVDRLAFMVADSGVEVVLCGGDSLPLGEVRVVSMDDPVVAEQPADPLGVECVPGQLAYVIYTSGSTGRPKGVAVAHGGVVNLAEAMRPVLGVAEGVRVLQFASFSFDAAPLTWRDAGRAALPARGFAERAWRREPRTGRRRRCVRCSRRCWAWAGGCGRPVSRAGGARQFHARAVDGPERRVWFAGLPGAAGHDRRSDWQALAGGTAAGELVKAVKEQVRAVPGDGLGHDLLRHLNPDTAPVLAAAPAPEIGFTYMGRFTAGTDARTADSRSGAARPWEAVGEAALEGSADPETPLSHLLEAGAMVRDTPDGPELRISLSGPPPSWRRPTPSASAVPGWRCSAAWRTTPSHPPRAVTPRRTSRCSTSRRTRSTSSRPTSPRTPSKHWPL
ncbi:D-alanine--D-alanyl carrier protein ligase [Streptomyces alboniger]